MAINVAIDPNLEAFVIKEVEAGQYSSPSEVVNQSLELLRARKNLKGHTREEIVNSLGESDEQIARGEGLESADVFKKIREILPVSTK